jgi:flagellar hook-associated protein 1
MSGLFGTFNVAKRGMFVHQKAIDVTSHNIANANTEGFSRQRAIIETTRPAYMQGNSSKSIESGTGSQIQAIERVRDSFMDYQVRNETSTYGEFEARQTFLTEVESIFNEPSETGLSTLMGKFFDSWQQLSKQAQSSNARTVVVQQSAALADELNHTYKQLEKLKEHITDVTRTAVFEVTNIVKQLDQINKQIIGVKVAGNTPNDLMDKRDLLLDKLSTKFNLTVDKRPNEGIYVSVKRGDGTEIKGIIEAMEGDNPQMLAFLDELTLAPGETAADLKFQPAAGELKGYVTVLKDIDDYMGQLNKLAKSLAFSVNAVHSGMAETSRVVPPPPAPQVPDKDYMPFFVNSDKAKYKTDNTMANLDGVDGILAGENSITAGNISVNKELIYGVMKLKTRTKDDEFKLAGQNDIDGETDGARALAIAGLRNALMTIDGITNTTTRASFINGKLKENGLGIDSNVSGMKIDNYFRDTVDRLGIQTQQAKRMVRNQETLLNSFEETRQSISGVSIDEEMANLVAFQHAYQANAKIIATVDELLEVVVNGLKR